MLLLLLAGWELLDGGVQHATTSSTDLSPAGVRDRSLEALHNVTRALRAALPAAIELPGTRRSIDEDFFAIANAPLAVLAGGFPRHTQSRTAGPSPAYRALIPLATEGPSRLPSCLMSPKRAAKAARGPTTPV